MFINRTRELSILNQYRESINTGSKINIAIFGLRRIGKTELLLQFKNNTIDRDVLIPYINLQKIIPDIEGFVKAYSKELVYETIKQTEQVDYPYELEDLLILASKLGDMETHHVRTILNILKQQEIAKEEILQLTFAFAQKLAEKHGQKIIFILDEFQELLQVHPRFLQIMRSMTEKQNDVNYWISGSVFSVFDEMLNHKNPFFGQFIRMTLENFDRASTHKLIDSELPFELAGNHKDKIYKFTNGQPYYTVAVCRKISEQYTLDSSISTPQVNYCIMNEIFSDTGSINEHFEYILDVSLAKFKNKDRYKSILFLLSQNPTNLTQVSKHIKKPTGEISNYLKALLKTDLIYRKQGTYHIRDPLFAFWVNNKYLGLSTNIVSEKVAEHLLANLEEKYQKASTELGIAKEYEVKYKLKELYDIDFEKYLKNNIEFHLVGTKDETVYIFEIKWRNKKTSYNDIDNLVQKTNKSEFSTQKRLLFFISKSGYTQSAIELASHNKIALLDGHLEEIKAIRK
ncbi:MAG: ArsR family transcriptional regulator [ANME-2 cluster archaeon]|jgi:AAA+ ATPase superfamily predicted ATPase|nr:ArsR family transcriptional regulator [ANME-2 cluster archaeon]